MSKQKQIPVTVWNFSGGRTSAFMTIHGYKPGDIVLFCDTGREHPKTYKFINDFEAHEQIPVTRIRYGNDMTVSPFTELLRDKKYKGIPNKTRRICTSDLKIVTAKRYLRKIGVRRFVQNIGFRYDESKRVFRHVERFKRVQTLFPLFDKKIKKEHIEEYWKQKPYNLEIPSILGNCTLCFMKGQNAIMAILREFPELADPWIEDERLASESMRNVKKTPGLGQYFLDVRMEDLKNIAQNNLFSKYPLEDISPAYSCACTP